MDVYVPDIFSQTVSCALCFRRGNLVDIVDSPKRFIFALAEGMLRHDLYFGESGLHHESPHRLDVIYSVIEAGDKG